MIPSSLLGILLLALISTTNPAGPWTDAGARALPAPESAAPWQGMRSAGGAIWVENRGQHAASIRYTTRIGQVALGAEEQGILVWLGAGAETSTVVRLAFAGASSKPAMEARQELPGLYSYFFGNDPSRWVRGARSYAEVVYRDVWPGIDVLFRCGPAGLKYDILLATGADPASLVLRCEGAQGPDQEADGSLRMSTAAGAVHHVAGRTYQLLPGGVERDVACRIRKLDEQSFGFELGAFDRSLPLVIDPGLVWSTYLGSASNNPGDAAYAAAGDKNGDVTVVGETSWSDFPTTPGAYQHPGSNGPAAGMDLFVTRLRGSDGQILFSSLIGGKVRERGTAVGTDAMARPIVAGWTTSTDFPTTTGVFDPTKDANNDSAFALRLSATGDTLEYSTFIEGLDPWDYFRVSTLAVDQQSGAVVIAGFGLGATLPATPGAFQTTWNTSGWNDGFIVRLSPDATAIEWGTYLGGNKLDDCLAVALDHQGRVAVTGKTVSQDFPVTPGVFQPQIGFTAVNTTAFVTILDPTGSNLVWSSYLGGSQLGGYDEGSAVVFDPQGGVIVVGATNSSTFPTTAGAYQTSFGSGYQTDAFFTRFNPDGASLIYSTFVGGSELENPRSITIDSSGIATAAGYASSTLPVTPGAYQPAFGGIQDAFIVRLDPSGRRLLYCSYLGGAAWDWGHGIAATPEGRVFVAGLAQYPGLFPTTPNAPFPIYAGGPSDVFVSAVEPYLDGIRPFGKSTPSCTGPLRLNAWRMPVAGDDRFGVYCSGAPPTAQGWLLKGSPAQSAKNVNGADVWIDLGSPLERIPATSTADGYAEVPLPLSSTAPGERVSVQFLFEGTVTCGSPGTWSASNALTITAK